MAKRAAIALFFPCRQDHEHDRVLMHDALRVVHSLARPSALVLGRASTPEEERVFYSFH